MKVYNPIPVDNNNHIPDFILKTLLKYNKDPK